MTDQPSHYSDPSGVTLTIDGARGWGKPEHVSVSIGGDGMQIPSDFGMFIPTVELLAMIDAEDPHAMHTYLRETTDTTGAEIEAESAWYGDDAEGGVTAAAIEHEVPEADSPEDTDEPDPVEQMRESGRQLGEAWRALTDAFREGVNR